MTVLVDFSVIAVLILGISQFRRPAGARLGNWLAALALGCAFALVLTVWARRAAPPVIDDTPAGAVRVAIQQARAYQAARAGLELGIRRVLNGQACAAVFDLDGFRVAVAACPQQNAIELPEESRSVGFFSVVATAEAGAPGSPDYAYRQLTATVEQEN